MGICSRDAISARHAAEGWFPAQIRPCGNNREPERMASFETSSSNYAGCRFIRPVPGFAKRHIETRMTFTDIDRDLAAGSFFTNLRKEMGGRGRDDTSVLPASVNGQLPKVPQGCFLNAGGLGHSGWRGPSFAPIPVPKRILEIYYSFRCWLRVRWTIRSSSTPPTIGDRAARLRARSWPVHSQLLERRGSAKWVRVRVKERGRVKKNFPQTQGCYSASGGGPRDCLFGKFGGPSHASQAGLIKPITNHSLVQSPGSETVFDLPKKRPVRPRQSSKQGGGG